jgi:hypothetical protein
MNPIIEHKYNQLENSRKKLIEELRKYDNHSLESVPAPGKWSVSQVFYHLNKAEGLSISYVRKKMPDINNLKKTGVTEYVKLMVLKLLFVSPIKFKAPVKVLGGMPEMINYVDIIKQWDNTRIEMKKLLESMPEDVLHKNVFKQPAIGRINIFQMLDFMQSHFDRHRNQVNKIVKITP